MIIKNITKNTTIAFNARIADNFLTRLIGLLLTSRLDRGDALIISSCNRIHTIGMKYPIDVIFLDQNYKVVKIAFNLSSCKISTCLNASYVIEMPSGIGRSSRTGIGDMIAMV